LPPLPAKSLKPGTTIQAQQTCQRLLVALGDAAPTAPDAPAPQSLAPPLVDALKHFQSRHGEKADGVLGAAHLPNSRAPSITRAANRTHHGTLALAAFGTRDRAHHRQHSAVPSVCLRVDRRFEAHIRQMDVIVGKSFDTTQTPVFAADMSYLIFRPYWEVPYNIALKRDRTDGSQ